MASAPPDDTDDAAAAISARIDLLHAALRQIRGEAPAAEQWVCTKEAAGLSGFSDESVYRWASGGEIRSRRTGGRLEIEVNSLFARVGAKRRA